MRVSRLSELLELIEHRAQPGFIDSESLGRVKTIAGHVPALATDFFGFERRLNRDDRSVDFAVGLNAYGIDWLSAERRWNGVALAIDGSRPWNHEAAPPWLEFDTSVEASLRLPPSVYVGFDPRRDCDAEKRQHSRDVASSLGLQHLRALDDCFAALPFSVSRVYIGYMLARASKALRLTIGTLTYRELFAYLDAVRWGGNRSDLRDLIGCFSGLCRRVCLQIDVAEHVLPSIGIELVSDKSEIDERRDSDARLFARLKDYGLCSSLERDRLLQWPSFRRYGPDDCVVRPASVRDTSERVLDGYIVTALHHVKFKFVSRRDIETKAYFGAYVLSA